MGGETFDVYWAAPMFSASEQAFNKEGAAILRALGLSVFLPQEHAVNIPTVTPEPEDVFRADTVPLLSSRVLVAVLDGEVIDSGVACEIGIAHQNAIPVAGLYTDFRQHRTGIGSSYRNLFVMGAIFSNGGVVSTLEDLSSIVMGLLSDRRTQRRPTTRMEPRLMDAFLRDLESWYDPPWTVRAALPSGDHHGDRFRVLDFGCGTGRLARALASDNSAAEYVGFDVDAAAIAFAKSVIDHPRVSFHESIEDLLSDSGGLFDLVVLAFVLHDHDLSCALEIVRSASRFVNSGGQLLVVDLATWDLPKLTRILRRKLAASHGPDHRLDAERISALASAVETPIQDLQLLTLDVAFPTQDALLDYCNAFGILRGNDLPLGFARGGRSPIDANELFESCAFPFSDRRAFAIVTLGREG